MQALFIKYNGVTFNYLCKPISEMAAHSASQGKQIEMFINGSMAIKLI